MYDNGDGGGFLGYYCVPSVIVGDIVHVVTIYLYQSSSAPYFYNSLLYQLLNSIICKVPRYHNLR